MSKSDMAEKDAAGIGMNIASEAITNIRTVASLSELFEQSLLWSAKPTISYILLQGKRMRQFYVFLRKWKMFKELHARDLCGVDY